MSDDTIIITSGRPSAGLLVHFFACSQLEYPFVGELDARLHTWTRQEGCWAVASYGGVPTGIACITTLDDGDYAWCQCLFWLEVFTPFRGCGIGRALLDWASAQSDCLVIAPTPESTPFYAALLPQASRHKHMFVVVNEPQW